MSRPKPQRKKSAIAQLARTYGPGLVVAFAGTAVMVLLVEGSVAPNTLWMAASAAGAVTGLLSAFLAINAVD